MAGLGGFAPGHAAPAKGPAKSSPKAPANVGGIAANNPLLNPGQTLSGPALYQAAQGLATAQTAPAIKALVDQIAQDQRQTTGAENLTGNYFQQLGQQAQQGLTAEQGISSSLNDQLKQLASDQSSQLQGLGQQDVATLAKYTPQSDSSNSLLQPGLSALTSELARQQGLQAQQQGAARAFGMNQGANYQGLAASNLGSFASRGEEDLNQIAQAGQIKNQPLTSKIAQLQGTYGATLASDLGKLRQQEITNRIAEKGLGIKQSDLQLQQQLQAFNTNPNAPGSPANQRVTSGRVAQQNANTNATKATNQANQQAFNQNPNAIGSPAWQRVQSLNDKNWSSNPNAVGSPAWARVQTANARGGGGGAKPLSTNENNAWFGKLGTVEQLIQDAQKQSVNGKPPTEQQIRDAMATGNNPAKTKFDPFMVQVAYELLGYGSVDSTTAAEMHNQYGLRGGTFRGQPIKVTPAYQPPTNPAGGAAQVLKTLGNTF